MKIGILTLPFNNNYGGYLQAYALLTVLKQQGHEAEIIYRRPRRRPFNWIVETTIKNILKILLGRKVWCVIPDQEKELRAKGFSMMPFVDKFISPRTKPLYSSKSLDKYINHRYDAIIVGSDQVWRPDYVSNIEDFFLSRLHDDTIKLSYAASFGTDNPKYRDEQKESCGKSIRLFKAVSVREKDAIDVIEKLGWGLGCKPQQVLDPTMLLDKNIYEQHIGASEIKGKRKIFCYVLDQSPFVSDVITEVTNITGCDVYQLGVKSDGNFASIEEWLRAIKDAEVVITDSYHGTVFSIIFNKPFFVCVNAKRGMSRFESLLSLFRLNHRVVNSKDDVDRLLKENIDWSGVNKVLDEERKRSIDFLKKNLK